MGVAEIEVVCSFIKRLLTAGMVRIVENIFVLFDIINHSRVHLVATNVMKQENIQKILSDLDRLKNKYKEKMVKDQQLLIFL